MDCALAARPDKDWNYTVPQSNPPEQGYSIMTNYDYYLVRGFAVVEACGIGTYGSTSFATHRTWSRTTGLWWNG